MAAEARGKEIELVATARAKEITLVAEAQAKEIELVGSAIATHGEVAALFELGKRQVSAMEQLAASKNAKTLVLPTDATKLLGGLAAVTEGLQFGIFNGKAGRVADGPQESKEETGG